MPRKARNVRVKYIASALVALAMIVFGAVNSAINTRSNVADFGIVYHTRSVILALQKTLSGMQDLETGQRGYLLTGEDSYLDAYRTGADRFENQFKEVGSLIVDNPVQQHRLERLREASVRKKAELTETIALRVNGDFEGALKIVKSGGGKTAMDEFRAIIVEMTTAEESLLLARRTKLINTLEATNRVVLITGGIAILSGAVGVGMLLLFFRSQERLEKVRSDKDRAIQSDQAKSEFLAMMSHEIRTPMNAILGFGEMLEDSLETSQQKHYAKAILSSGNSLLLLINDILDLSKIEASKLELHPELVAMPNFCENLETLFSFRAQEKGVDYLVDLDASVPSVLTLDALRLRQILVNLIGNALKFTSVGKVHVRVRAQDLDGERLMLHFDVIDTGIGIAQTELNDIFRPFYQVDSRNSRHFQGTGLGLSISERLAKVMEGAITVVSEPGKGSTFHLAVPAHRSTRRLQPETEIKEAIDFNRLAPSKILVADDVPLNRELIRGYLLGSHHEIYEAENGEQAVILSKKYLPDIVLLDIRMPVMDGREARLRLKNMEETKHIPLIAVSASSLLNSQAELKSLFDGFADKPLNRTRLFLELSRFLPAAEPGKEADESNVENFNPKFIEEESLREPDKLVEALQKLAIAPWPELVKLVPAQATIAFANRIADLAQNHQSSILEIYARNLLRAAETLELETAGRLLENFPKVVDHFSKPHA